TITNHGFYSWSLKMWELLLLENSFSFSPQTHLMYLKICERLCYLSDRSIYTGPAWSEARPTKTQFLFLISSKINNKNQSTPFHDYFLPYILSKIVSTVGETIVETNFID
ncbi:hypothetical protein FF021_17570, partial [Leptospira noguchii]